MSDEAADSLIIVVGLDRLGLATVERLVASGVRVHAMGHPDRAADCRQELRRLGVPLIVGAARIPEELAAAGLQSAAVLALTDADAVNLLVLLALRRRAPRVPVVLRLNSRELSMHVATAGGALAASPIEISSEEFARAALDACRRAAS